jgi:hypothetical protein
MPVASAGMTFGGSTGRNSALPSRTALRMAPIGQVAGDLKSVIETVDKTIPGATVVGAPVGQPVDAIAANVVPAEVHVSPVPSNQPSLHPFHPGAEQADADDGGRGGSSIESRGSKSSIASGRHLTDSRSLHPI